MARPSREAIDSFISITGASESLAVQKLEEHGSDLNEAVNAHFSQGDRSRPRASGSPVFAPSDDMMDVDNLFSGLGYRMNRNLFDGSGNFTNQAPFVTHPREVRQIPIEVKDGSGASDNHENAPRIEDVTEDTNAHGPDVHGTVSIDDEDDEDVATDPTVHDADQGSALDNQIRPSAQVYNDMPSYDIDIEEEMVRAAIELSKKDAERGFSEQNVGEQDKVRALSGRLDVGSSSIEDEAEDLDQQPLIRNRSRSKPSGSQEAQIVDSPPTSPTHDNLDNHLQHNGGAIASEWGGISSLEHDEAVMLEAAMFGGIPEGPEHRFPYGPRPFVQRESSYAPRVPRPPSPSLEAQRLIREQQDDEYLASLQADREKEQKAQAEAEARRLEEEAAKEAALKEERERKEENRRKLEEEQELERQLAEKKTSLPREPSADDENVICLLVKMPDGSRRGRRFLKSDKLQLLFDFIDIGRAVKPGTYRVVRPYPRRAFSGGESSLTLNELGLTSKQEALFLELI